MQVEVSERGPEAIDADACVIVFRAPDKGLVQPPLAEHLRQDAGRLIARRAEASTWLESRGLPAPRMLLYCLGPALERWDPRLEYLGGHAGSFDRAAHALGLDRELRIAGARIERACNEANVRHAVLAAWPSYADPRLIVEGAVLRAHDPRAWEPSRDGPTPTTLRKLTISTQALSKAARRRLAAQLATTRAILDATNFSRELGDLPSNHGTASAIVERVRARVSASGSTLAVSTISAQEAEGLGMGLFRAVDAGASERGCILRLDHDPRRGQPRQRREDARPIVFVGKGLTHDTGGYNLKTSPALHQLTHDKCGATAVIGAMLAIAAIDVPARVIGLCPLTENVVDAHAFKPGDVLRACNDVTVYVENTDAEGRLVLADVLAWLQGLDPRPELVVDLATLTHASHAALGEPFAALYCNEDRAREELVAAGKACGELLWPMPIHDVHDRDLGHHKADLRNIGVAAGSPSSAAAFLRSFVNYPWAHVDLAGKSHTEFAREYYGAGATGFGCRLLVEFAQRAALRG